MNTPCPTCRHARPDGRPCAHPLVAPFEGEPPSELGSAVLDWIASDARQHVVERDGRRLIPRKHNCPGRAT